MEFSRDRQLTVYTGAICVAPSAGPRHWPDQPVLAPGDDYTLDVETLVIDATPNRSPPVVKLSVADLMDNFYADEELNRNTERAFNGGAILSGRG